MMACCPPMQAVDRRSIRADYRNYRQCGRSSAVRAKEIPTTGDVPSALPSRYLARCMPLEQRCCNARRRAPLFPALPVMARRTVHITEHYPAWPPSLYNNHPAVLPQPPSPYCLFWLSSPSHLRPPPSTLFLLFHVLSFSCFSFLILRAFAHTTSSLSPISSTASLSPAPTSTQLIDASILIPDDHRSWRRLNLVTHL